MNTRTLSTAIPYVRPIELVDYYEEFKDYYPFCEMQTKRWFVENVEPDWWIFDVGANIGYYSILFSRLAPAGRVFAFEPTRTVDKLRRNLSANDVNNVIVEEIALGNGVGRREDTIFRIWGQEAERGLYSFETLDHYCDRSKVERVDCIKIDTASFDFEVLMGCERTLRRFNPWVVVELNHALSKRNQSATQALEWLNDRGYFEALVADYDNFILRRRVAPDTPWETGFRLFFDRRSFLKDSEIALGPLIPGLVHQTPEFHNEASRTDRVGNGEWEVTAPGPRWSYAVSFPISEREPDKRSIAIMARVVVKTGTLGVGCLTMDDTEYVGGEVFLSASPEEQQAIVALPPLAATSRIVFRNADPLDAETHFVIKDIAGFAVLPDSGKRRPAYAEPRATHIDVAELREELAKAESSA
jgi:FkbM family methyltransferase